MSKPDAATDAAIGAVGDQVQALLDAAGVDALGFAILIDVGGGTVGIESRSRIPVSDFASLLARRAAALGGKP